MIRLSVLFGFWLLMFSPAVFAQNVSERVRDAYQRFELDSQLSSAISSLYVINAKTGAIVFEKNARIGLAPASTQKIITSVTAFELLGPAFRYVTELGFSGSLNEGTLEGNIVVRPSGDPTFGSWRWKETGDEYIISKFSNRIKNSGVHNIHGSVIIQSQYERSQLFPDGWIMQDIGNYYGAGSSYLNWRENQFEVYLNSGSVIGDPVTITGYKPRIYGQDYKSLIVSARPGSGDNAYIYHHPNLIRGTIPVNEKRFVISGSIQNPPWQFQKGLNDTLRHIGVDMREAVQVDYDSTLDFTLMEAHYSPPLDSIIYWFNKKSINLYGESLVKTLSVKNGGNGSTEDGLDRLRSFWKENGVSEKELNMSDGSGLSPLNRVTTHAQVEILKYAKSRKWFLQFYHSLPEYNGMAVKSGTISDVKGFCGYHKAKDGTEYILSFLVNNYNGRSSSLVGKMFKVMDELK